MDYKLQPLNEYKYFEHKQICLCAHPFISSIVSSNILLYGRRKIISVCVDGKDFGINSHVEPNHPK